MKVICSWCNKEMIQTKSKYFEFKCPQCPVVVKIMVLFMEEEKKYKRGHIIEGTMKDILENEDRSLEIRIQEALWYIVTKEQHYHWQGGLAAYHFWKWLQKHNIKDEYFLEQL